MMCRPPRRGSNRPFLPFALTLLSAACGSVAGEPTSDAGPRTDAIAKADATAVRDAARADGMRTPPDHDVPDGGAKRDALMHPDAGTMRDAVASDATDGGDARAPDAGGCDAGASGVQCVASSGLLYVNGDIAVDDQNVYWFAYGQASATILRVARSGGTPAPLVADDAATSSTGSGLATDGVHVYWGTIGGDGASIRAASVDGGSVVTLAPAGDPYCVAVDDESVYWTDGASFSVMKVPKTGGAPVTLASSAGYEIPLSLVIDSTSAYWIGQSGVLKISKDGGVPVNLLDAAPATILNATNSECRMLAIVGGNLIVALHGSNEILRIPLTDAGAPLIVASPPAPSSVVADSTHVYWAQLDTDLAIAEAPPDGGTTTTLAAPEAHDVFDMALASDGTLYWTTNTQIESLAP
jgi:hypothetical protein